MAVNKPIKIKQRRELNIGIVLFLFVLLYLVVKVYYPLSKKQIAVCEVREGSAYSPKTYQSMCLRTEKVYKSSIDGYVNYYFSEGDRIKKNQTILSIGEDKSVYDNELLKEYKIELSEDDIYELKQYLYSEYDESEGFSYYDYLLKDFQRQYRKKSDELIIKNIEKLTIDSGIRPELSIVKSDISGIISFNFDNYSGLTVSDFTINDLNGEYIYTKMTSGDKIIADFPVFKIIVSDEWNIISVIDEAFYNELSDEGNIDFSINKDKKLSASFKKYKKEGICYLLLYMDKYIARYSDKRIVNVTYYGKEETGLKIPSSALAYKRYYRIPEKYFITYQKDADTVVPGFIVERITENGEVITGFFETDIFWRDNGFCYVSGDLINSNETIVIPDENRTAMLYSFEILIQGVYNVNNGYAVFKRIEPIASEDGFIIVKKNSGSGINAYDHIALDSENVVEGSVIY